MSEIRCLGCMNLKQSSPVCEHCGYDERRSNAPHQLPPGTVLRDQYVVGRVLGQGGFGITYIGWDLFLDIPVAIKEYYPNTVVTRNCTVSNSVFLLSEESKDLFVRNRDRFAREARSLAKLGAEGQMPNIVRVQNLVQANDTAYIIMEYVRGIDLRSYMLQKGGVLSPEEMIRLLHPIMVSLEKLHGHNIIHRDLSPDNIMVLPNGDTKLIDFGAVHEVHRDEMGYQHSTTSIVKNGFAPPEQYTRRGNLGPWTDVYAMSATVYYCLTGHVPPSVQDRQFDGEPIDWTGVDPQFRKALEKGLNLRIEDRYQSMVELLDSLSAVPIQKKPEEKKKTAPARKKEVPQAVLPTTETTVETKKPKRKKWPILAGAAVAALAILAGLFFFKVPQEKEGQAVNEPPAVDQGNWEDNVLMHTYDGFASENDKDYLKKTIYRSDIRNDQIRSITFLATLTEAPEDSWDVSANSDGSVKAWAILDDSSYSPRYDLYIAANGGINGRESCRDMFLYFMNLKQISFNDAFHTENAPNMYRMFAFCSELKNIDLQSFDTSSAINMEAMFSGCHDLISLNLSGFDTANVTCMRSMFAGCRNLLVLDISGFNTSNVTDMSDMFNQCAGIQILNMSGFDTGKVTDMSSMFCGCSSLRTVDLCGFDTTNVTDMSYLFHNCSSLQSLDLGSFNTINVTDMSSMFYGCGGLQTLDVSSFDTGRVTTMNAMFMRCKNLQKVEVKGFDTASVTDMSFMFSGCSSLTALDVSHFNKAAYCGASSMFSGTDNLSNITLTGLKKGELKDSSFMDSGDKINGVDWEYYVERKYYFTFENGKLK